MGPTLSSFSSPGSHPDFPNLGHRHTVLQIRNAAVLGHVSPHPPSVRGSCEAHPREVTSGLCSTSTSAFISGFILCILAFLNSSACRGTFLEGKSNHPPVPRLTKRPFPRHSSSNVHKTI